jgi:hypothetical protein
MSLSGSRRLLVSLGAGILSGVALALIIPDGRFGANFLSSALLLTVGYLALMSAWNWAGGGRMLAWMTALAFFLRLGCGVAISLALPVYGSENETQKAGYVFFDAFRRDEQAWQLAESKEPLWESFQEEFYTDQYGGLLALSALVYRYSSPDFHRSQLVIILAAFAAALCIPFFWQGVRKRWGVGVAVLAGWILALYPESVLLGASQMREPFMISLGVIAFWAVLSWLEHKRTSLVVFIVSMLGLALFSSRIAVVVLGFLAVWFWLDYVVSNWDQRRQVLGWIILAAAGLVLLFVSWEWFRSSAYLDLRMTVINSGFLDKVIGNWPWSLQVIFIVVYGLLQPMLPAAIAETSLPLWKTIVILRSLGWYLMAPGLIYSLFVVWKFQPERERYTMIWLAGFTTVWVLLSSARGGGDVWDNPRYRTILLPWLALLASWAVLWAYRQRDVWLVRILMVEAIFLAFFTHWYLSRYLNLWKKLPFWQTIALGMAVSALLLGASWLWKLRRKKAS